MFAIRTLRVVLLIIAAFFPAGKALAQSTFLKQAEAEFSRQHYDRAIVLYRKHLRKYPNDMDAWNFLAANYYHTGLPEKALRTFRDVNKRSRLKSYNHFYQGLCYSVLDAKRKATNQFVLAAKSKDEWGANAAIELAVQEYNDRNEEEALRWASYYLQAFPNGPQVNKAKAVRDAVQKGEFKGPMETSQRPELAEALFRYSPYSFMGQPHYWFLQLGYEYDQGRVNNPGRDNTTGLPTVKTEGYANHDILLNAGFGLGPLATNGALSYFGYHYYQDWSADTDRITTFLKDPGDIEYIPFRPDLMSRHHQLFGYFKKNTNKYFHYGVLGSYEFSKVGSSLIPTPGDVGVKKALNVAQTSLLMPWIGIRPNDNYELISYLFLRKELNEEAPEFSNKTYNFLSSAAEKTISFGIDQRFSAPGIRTNFRAEIFKYDYIFNDYWLDFSRTGLLLGAEHMFSSSLDLTGSFGLYQDRYTLEQLKANSCSFDPSIEDIGQREIKICPRLDTGTVFTLGFTWNLSPFSSINGYYSHKGITNKTMKVFERTQDMFGFMYNFAFPSVKKVTPLWRRFGDDEIMRKMD